MSSSPPAPISVRLMPDLLRDDGRSFRSTPAATKIRNSCRRARCWWSAPARPARRSPKNCCARRPPRLSLGRPAHAACRAAIAAADLIWWLDDARRRRDAGGRARIIAARCRSSPAPMAATPSISAALPPTASTLLGRVRAARDGVHRHRRRSRRKPRHRRCRLCSFPRRGRCPYRNGTASTFAGRTGRPRWIAGPTLPHRAGRGGWTCAPTDIGCGDLGHRLRLRLRLDRTSRARCARRARAPPRRVTEVPGLYFLGLQWLSRMKSSFLSGVGDDAAVLADHIAVRG